MNFFAFLLSLFTLVSAAACSDPQCMADELRVGMTCRSVAKARSDAAVAAPGDVDGSLTAAATGDASGLRDGAAPVSSRPDGGDVAVPSAADALLDALPGGPPSFQYRADTVTLSGGNVAAIPNRRGADALVLAAGTLAAPARDVLFAGAPSLSFATTAYLDSSLPASAWTFLHDGTGFEAFSVYTSTSPAGSYVFGTASAGTGIQHYSTGVGGVGLYITHGGTAVVNQSAGAGSALPSNTAGYSDVYYSASAPVNYLAFAKDAPVASGSHAFAPDTGNPSATFRLGAQPTTNTFSGPFRWCETLIFPRVLHEYERQLVREYIQVRYGIAAPVLAGADREIMSLLPFSWLDAAAYDTSGGKVTAFLDRAQPGHRFAQRTAANQVSNPSPDASFGSAPSATFSGTQWYESSLAASAWSFCDDGSGMTLHSVLVPSSISGAQNTYFASRAGEKGLSVYGAFGAFGFMSVNASVQIMFNLTANASSDVALSARCRHSSAGFPQGQLKFTGAAPQSSGYAFAGTAGAPQGTMRVGANSSGTQLASMRLASAVFLDRDANEADANRLAAALATKYGLSP